ncbi:MAG: enoyl-CoA hydratase/isomerase family protein [Saprospiraceae bacterium]|nr:enoyl-CoA hydratase/isomerase family protein [Saprospiraceae bacterium]
MIQYIKDTDNIVTLTLDMAGRSYNVLNHEIIEAFRPVIKHLQAEKAKRALKGVIITSAKKSFLYGGDLEYLYQADKAEDIYTFSQAVKEVFRDLERPGVPVVAAINGSALGIGVELALACHHRIVIDNPEIRMGLPEVNIGVMPGGGGVIRLLWLLGLEKAFDLLEMGKRMNPDTALAWGLIDELAKDEREMLEKARSYCLSTTESRRSWDIPGQRIPGGNSELVIRKLAARTFEKYRGNYPAPLAILNTLAEGSKLYFDAALQVESRYFTDLLLRKEAKNMIKAFWLDRKAVSDGISRPKGFGKFRPKRIGVIGAGKMGSGIALTCLENGMQVVLKDVSKLIAARGLDYVRKNLDGKLSEGLITAAKKEKLLKRITTTDEPDDFRECDLVIEAVFENENVKKKVTKESEICLDDYAIFATNTISIPITRLSSASSRPKNYVGLHFFRPVEEVPLVEIVCGANTSDETLARAYDFVKAIRKTPIVVKDDWGFFVARVQNTYILEGISLLQEGVSPALIENLGRAAGMPVGPLELADEISLKLVLKYENQSAEHYGPRYIQHPAVPLLERMIHEFDRPGGNGKNGFYETQEDGSKRLWQEFIHHFPNTNTAIPKAEIMERFLFAQALEAVWCLQEKVIRSVPETNLGSLYGWGFPAFQGGVIQYIHSYGKADFISRCAEFKSKYGPRFQVPAKLQKLD